MDDQLAQMIGARVRAARVANKQTQVVIAGLCGITADYLYQIERGRKIPTPVQTQLATVLHMPVAQFLDGPPVRRALASGTQSRADDGRPRFRAGA